MLVWPFVWSRTGIWLPIYELRTDGHYENFVEDLELWLVQKHNKQKYATATWHQNPDNHDDNNW